MRCRPKETIGKPPASLYARASFQPSALALAVAALVIGSALPCEKLIEPLPKVELGGGAVLTRHSILTGCTT
jgi:hypothetical protein